MPSPPHQGPTDMYGRALTTPEEIIPEMWRAQIAQGEQLNRIEAQALKTNGRVSSLERWRYVAAGGLAVVSAIVVPIFLGMVAK